MAIRSHASRDILAALVVVAALATRTFGYFDSFEVYAIEGYLDRVPSGATVVARLDIGTGAAPRRQLLVTSYRSRSHENHPLSRERYLLRGDPEHVARLLDAPAGSAVEGTFAIYSEATPSLLIASLDRPA